MVRCLNRRFNVVSEKSRFCVRRFNTMEDFNSGLNEV